jgi:hypothetical protein
MVNLRLFSSSELLAWEIVGLAMLLCLEGNGTQKMRTTKQPLSGKHRRK